MALSPHDIFFRNFGVKDVSEFNQQFCVAVADYQADESL